MIEKAVMDTTLKLTQEAAKGVEKMIRKAWTPQEAAVEKPAPSQYLSDAGIKAIQGQE